MANFNWDKVFLNLFLVDFHQVRFLEQQNKMLETKWSLLQDKTNSRSSIDVMFENYIAGMRRQLEGQGYEKHRLETGLRDMNSLVEDFKSKWEKLEPLASVLVKLVCIFSQ